MAVFHSTLNRTKSYVSSPRVFYLMYEFYKKIGYKIKDHWDEEDTKGVMFETGTKQLLEIMYDPERDPTKLNRPWYVSKQVKDVDALYEYLKKKGFKVTRPKSTPWGDRFIKLDDPIGNGITYFSLIPHK